MGIGYGQPAPYSSWPDNQLIKTLLQVENQFPSKQIPHNAKLFILNYYTYPPKQLVEAKTVATQKRCPDVYPNSYWQLKFGYCFSRPPARPRWLRCGHQSKGTRQERTQSNECVPKLQDMDEQRIQCWSRSHPLKISSSCLLCESKLLPNYHPRSEKLSLKTANYQDSKS